MQRTGLINFILIGNIIGQPISAVQGMTFFVSMYSNHLFITRYGKVTTIFYKTALISADSFGSTITGIVYRGDRPGNSYYGHIRKSR